MPNQNEFSIDFILDSEGDYDINRINGIYIKIYIK